MNKRLKYLLIGLLVTMVVMFVVNQLWTRLIEKPLDQQDDLQGRLIDQIQTTKGWIRRSLPVQRRLETWRAESLPVDVQSARTLYQGWLHELMERVGLEKRFVDSGSPTAGPGYQVLPFTVRGTGTIDQFTQLLFEFYNSPHLHCLRSLKIAPIASGTRIDLTLAIDALAVNGCQRTDQLATGDVRSLAFDDLSAYRVITDRNLFGQNPKAEITEHTVLTAVVAVDDAAEAWFSSRIEDKLYKRRVGDTLQVGWFQGTIEAIEGHDVIVDSNGERWLLTKGDRLADAVALPPEY